MRSVFTLNFCHVFIGGKQAARQRVPLRIKSSLLIRGLGPSGILCGQASNATADGNQCDT